jgi:hypothetical protein
MASGQGAREAGCAGGMPCSDVGKCVSHPGAGAMNLRPYKANAYPVTSYFLPTRLAMIDWALAKRSGDSGSTPARG